VPGINITITIAITSASSLFSSQWDLAGASLHHYLSAVILGLPITGCTEYSDMAQVQSCRFLSEWTCNIVVKDSLAVELFAFVRNARSKSILRPVSSCPADLVSHLGKRVFKD
jgi:hypothetical protein